MDPVIKQALLSRLEDAHARATRHIRKIEIDLSGAKLDHQKHRFYVLMEYHLKARANARLAIEELEKL